MGAEWPKVSLREITSALGDGLHGTPKYDDSGECFFINGNNLRDGKIVITDKTKRVSKYEYDKYKKNINDRTILVSINGTLGNVALYAGEEVILGKSACYLNVNQGVDKFFVRYVLDSQLFQDYINNLATGSTIKNVSLKLMRDFTFKLPPLNVQQAVSSLLKSLDDKIQLNHQINQTLEQMAQAIFKSWFVDFEPIKAKIAAHQFWQTLQPENEFASPVCYAAELDDKAATIGDLDTYMNRAAMQTISGKTAEQLDALRAEDPKRYNELYETAALFPSKMQASELGEIPHGWCCLSLDQVAKYKNGLALQKFRPDSEDDYLPVVKISQLKKGYADGEEKASPSINPECIIDNGDVVFSWSGSLMVDTWCGGKAALNQHLFKVTSNIYPKWLYFHFTRHHLEEFQRIAADKAVTMGHIKREHLKQALCAVPDIKHMSVGKAIESMFEKQINMRLESLTLSQLRNYLLPELLSGNVSFSNKEEL